MLSLTAAGGGLSDGSDLVAEEIGWLGQGWNSPSHTVIIICSSILMVKCVLSLFCGFFASFHFIFSKRVNNQYFDQQMGVISPIWLSKFTACVEYSLIWTPENKY